MNLDDLASVLARGFRSMEVVDPPPELLPGNMKAAESLQDATVARIGTIAAWKLGATIASVRANLGLPHAFFGAIPDDHVVSSPAFIPADQVRALGIEPEIAYRLARDLKPGAEPLSDEVVRAAIGSVHPSIEIPSTRFAELGCHGGFALAGDNGATGWLVVGKPFAPKDEAGLLDQRVTVSADREILGEGSARAIEKGPFGALVEHVHRAHSRGYTLSAGQYIATGSCAGYVKVPPNEEVLAEFGAAGSVSLTFTRP